LEVKPAFNIVSILPSVNLKLECLMPSPERIIINLSCIKLSSLCPLCHQPSASVHSRYTRMLADLPWGGVPVQIVLQTRKFYCRTRDCRRTIFTERLPGVVEPYARQTIRFNEALLRLAWEMGGEAGARTAHLMALPVSADTLLRRIRSAHPSMVAVPRVLGVDDFAFRRGKKYGTILVDHERRATIDLLPDREADTLAKWLKTHPGVEVVTRDRSRAYAEGISTGAPDAVQIADRWHLIKNLSEALEKLLTRQHHHIRNAANPVIEIPQPMPIQSEPASQPVEEAHPSRRFFPGRLRKEVLERRDRHIALYNEVIELRQKGLSTEEIAKRVGKSPRTIRHWLPQGEYRERVRHRRSLLDTYFPYIAQRWDEGCRNVMELWRELVALGYRGSYKSLNNYLHRQDYLRHRERRSSAVRFQPQGKRPVRQARIETLIPTPSPRATVWMLLKQKELEEKQLEMTRNLCDLSPEVKTAQKLAVSFIEMVRQRKSEKLDEWIGNVMESRIPELKSFADGLMQDKKAVEAALKYEWSNGRVEGQINRLKLIKRQMYGRAKADLLKARVLRAA
jgi:transposase